MEGTTITSKTAKLDAVLRELNRRCSLLGSALVSEKGLIIISSLPHGSDERAVSAMAASILSIGHRVGEELQSGQPMSILIDGHKRTIIIISIESLVIIGIADAQSEIALIKFEMNEAVRRLKDILESTTE